jgi:hypothetical protein
VTPVVVARHGHKSFFFELVTTGLTCLVADGSGCVVDIAFVAVVVVVVVVDVHSVAGVVGT